MIKAFNYRRQTDDTLPAISSNSLLSFIVCYCLRFCSCFASLASVLSVARDGISAFSTFDVSLMLKWYWVLSAGDHPFCQNECQVVTRCAWVPPASDPALSRRIVRTLCGHSLFSGKYHMYMLAVFVEGCCGKHTVGGRADV